MPATTGMKGAGDYDQHSGAQHSGIQALQDRVDDAVAKLPLPAPAQPVTALDLGSSEGRNAVRLMAAIVTGLRRRTDQPLQTIYSDLASINFNQLFANLEEARRAGLFAAGVYPGAVGGSFYGPLLPPGTVHLATCFNSILWLDRLPAVPLPDGVAYRRPLPTRTGLAVSPPEATAAFTRQAEQDLVQFLECRARELVPGAKLLLASPGDTDQIRLCDGLFDVLNNACLDLVAAGRLERKGYERLTMPCYHRTVAELLAPLEGEDSPVRDAFTVDRAEALEIPIPFLVEFRRGGDVAAYAGAYTGFLRAFSEPVVRATLNQTEGELETVECLYERIRARLLAEPERYSWRYTLVAALLTRR
ncbi:MAG: cyclopropane-fatty-acyl-phospholipid synthase [Planctomycetaceae bacterium]|nr:cyclopropane-fatty-acyl-phospholipid synthase [Planctomycetaceae bacterium]